MHYAQTLCRTNTKQNEMSSLNNNFYSGHIPRKKIYFPLVPSFLSTFASFFLFLTPMIYPNTAPESHQQCAEKDSSGPLGVIVKNSAKLKEVTDLLAIIG